MATTDHAKDELHRIRHSAAHVLAQAVRDRFKKDGQDGEVQFGIGPPIADGFYYDFVLPRSLNDDDLRWIEKRMKKIVSQRHTFEQSELSPEEAREMFADQPFKLELIDGILEGALDEDGEPLPEGQAPKLTVYRHADFADLCGGPHVEDTRQINPKALKVLSIAGAYWRGDEKRPMLQRVYATAFRTKEELDQHLWRLAEAERRDHRKLGKQLELFHLDPTAPGMPYWLPKGFKLLTTLIDFWREEHEKAGYQEISTPLVNARQLWDISGHWEHYQENMFICPVDEHRTYGVKPMNCPNAMVVFNLKTRSYRDLPLRLSDCDVLHRNERSGALHGLLRVQKFQQDDAHIFITPDMIEEEYARVLALTDHFYSIFGLTYTLRLGTRPEKFIGDVETWDRAEAALRRILDTKAGVGQYLVEDGDGAFYGPKVDILMEDALGRQWQMGTIQLDFQLPRRFNCRYVDSDGAEKTPVVVHRVIYGSLERFIGILIEHTAGAFPVWLSPVQATLVPIADRHVEYAEAVEARLKAARIRVEHPDAGSRMNARIRQATLEKVPFILVMGDTEVEGGTVAVRRRDSKKSVTLSVDDFIAGVQALVASRAAESTELSPAPAE